MRSSAPAVLTGHDPDGSLADEFVGRALGVALSNINLGMALLTPHGRRTNYFALKASGTGAIVGVNGLTLMGSVELEVNGLVEQFGPGDGFHPVPGQQPADPTGTGLVAGQSRLLDQRLPGYPAT